MSKRRKTNFRSQVTSDVKRQKEKASSFGYLKLPKDVKIFKLEEDTRSIQMDFIPYEVITKHHPDRDEDEGRAIPGALWYKRPFKRHSGIGADNKTVVCLTSFGKKCPICEHVAELLKKDDDWDAVKDIAAKDRNLYAVIPLDSKKHDDEIHVWDMAQFLFQDELNDVLEEDPENGVFPDLEEGRTLEIKFRWKKFGKRSFPETRDIQFLERDEQYDDEILDEVPNLDEILIELSYKELQAMFFEEEIDDEDLADENDALEDEEDDKPKRRVKRNAVKEEEEEEEEKKPRRGTRGKVKEEEEEEEPEEKPRRRSTRSKVKEEEEDDKPPTRRTRASKSGKDTKNKCPHGYKFGEECEDHDECDSCDDWPECLEEKEKE